MADKRGRVILLAGGGTGGHLFPNMAVAEAVEFYRDESAATIAAHYLISDRQLDQQIADKADLSYTALNAAPLSWRPIRLMRFAMGFQQSRKAVRQQIDQLCGEQADCEAVMVATGGFVSGPAIAAARSMGIRCALLNLDAVAGKANRVLAHRVDRVFSCYASANLPAGRGGDQRRDEAVPISYPVRQAARATLSPQAAREKLGLDPDRHTLLVTAGSQGALTINQMMRQLVAGPRGRAALGSWQVLHLSGATMVEELRQGYAAANIPAVVEPFLDAMGLAWAAADLAISRSGAGAVGEAWANAVPCIFFPYPYHLDNHQKANARPLTDRGTSIICDDLKQADRNVPQLLPLLSDLIQNPVRLDRMKQMLRQSRPEDGARRVARWVMTGQ